ncbi:MAG: hypothetical protein AAFY04_07720 [Pseudomonadota bacterium]
MQHRQSTVLKHQPFARLVGAAVLVVAALACNVGLGLTGAQADQTDPTLDTLFEELRTGGAINAEANADRILEIWADSQSVSSVGSV